MFNSWSRRNGLSKYNFASFIFSFIRVGYFFSRGKYHANQSLFHLFEHDLRIERFHDLKNARKKRIQYKIYEKRKYHVFDIRNIKRRIVSRCKQNRSFQSHLFFSWMENELASLSFFANTALDGAAPCRIFRSTVIFTRVVAPQWILLLPRLLTISKPSRHRGFDPSPPYPIPCYSLFDSHCSKSLHRDPLLCFFYPYLPIRLDSIDNRDSIIDNHSDSVTFVRSSFASRGFDLHSRPFTEKKTFLE